MSTLYPYGLTRYEVMAFINFMMYYLPLDQRHKLMHEFPQMYNKLVGEVVVTTLVQDQTDT